jgi:FkbM family methyltransferase
MSLDIVLDASAHTATTLIGLIWRTLMPIKKAKYKNIEAEFELREDLWDGKFVDEIWEGEYYFKNDMEVTPDDVVLDVGAHVGIFSILAAKLGAKVIAYEPVPENIELLKKNIELNDCKVEVNERAITMFGGDIEFIVQEEGKEDRNTGTSRAYSGGKDGNYSVVVPSHSFYNSLINRDITYLKMDIEGYEYPLIYTTDFNRKPALSIKKITMEFHYEPEAAQHLAEYLESFGFTTNIKWAWGHQGRLQAWR